MVVIAFNTSLSNGQKFLLPSSSTCSAVAVVAVVAVVSAVAAVAAVVVVSAASGFLF